MNIPYALFCAIVLLTATINPAAAEPGSHSPQLIVLDQKVHVLTADGSNLLLNAMKARINWKQRRNGFGSYPIRIEPQPGYWKRTELNTEKH